LPTVVGRPDRVHVRHGAWSHEIAPAQRHAVEAKLIGGAVDHALDRVGHLGAAGAAIGVGRHGVGEHRARAQRRGRDRVGAGDERRALAERRERHATGADVADIRCAQPQESAVGTQRQVDRSDEIAPLIIGDKRLGACRGVFDRPAEFARRPQHQPELDIRAIACAEVAADVLRDHAQLRRRDAEHGGKLTLLPYRAATAGVERVAVSAGIIFCQSGARLDRHGGDAADMRFVMQYVIRARERAFGRRRIAESGVDQHIVGRFIPQGRRVGLERGGDLRHPGKFLIRDRHRLGRVERLRARFRHHHGDGFADVARLVGGQQRMRADEHAAAARARELQVGAGLRQRIVRNGLEAVGAHVLSRKYAEHARERAGARRVDRHDARVRMRRAYHRRVNLPVEGEVVAESPGAGDQAQVLLAPQRLADYGEL
jgi:hypothetical protein